MKVKKLKIFQNKSGLKGCKWSSLNAPGAETPESYPFLSESFSLIFSLRGNKKANSLNTFLRLSPLSRLQIVQFACAKVINLCLSFSFEDFPFPIFGQMTVSPLSSPPLHRPFASPFAVAIPDSPPVILHRPRQIRLLSQASGAVLRDAIPHIGLRRRGRRRIKPLSCAIHGRVRSEVRTAAGGREGESDGLRIEEEVGEVSEADLKRRFLF